MVTMFTLAVRSARSHLGRLLLTAFSVALAVSFWAGTSITSSTFNKTFSGLVTDIYADVDLVVRPTQGFAVLGFGDAETPLPASVVDTVKSTPGVDAVQPFVFDTVTVAGRNGKNLKTQGSFESWRAEKPLRPYEMVVGREPTAPNEVVIDRGTADKEHFAIGDTIRFTTNEGNPQTPTIVGLITYGKAESLPGQATVLGSLDWVGSITGKVGVYDRVWMTTVDDDSSSVRSQLAASLGSDADIVTGAKLREDAKSSLTSVVTVLRSVLTGFAVVALLVGSFLIANTFSMLVTQRAREIALLRAIGAAQRQVRRSVLIEAALVGFAASAVGLGIGVGIAKLLIGLLKSSGIDVEIASLVITPGTIINALLIGVGTTVLSAWLPIRRATKISPIAALRDNAVETVARVSKRRVALGTVPAVAGLAMIVAGSGSDPSIALAAGGGGLLVFGAVVLSPVLSRPCLALIGKLMPGRGMAAHLASENVRRNPRRSAATASALLIGLTLVTGFTVIAASVQESLVGGAQRQIRGAEAIVQSTDSGIDDAVVASIAATPGVKRVGGAVFGVFKRNGSATFVTGVDTSLDGLVYLDLRDGTKLADLGPDEVFVYKNQYKDGLRVGDKVEMEFARTGMKTFTVAGVYDNNSSLADYTISRDAYRANFVSQTLDWAVVDAESPTSAVTAAKAATQGTEAAVRTVDDFAKDLRKQIDTLLKVVIGLLGVALIIALMGIVNTMALSVLERTREIGLLRAVGMSRSQVRSTIRREAIMIALYGVLFGLLLGSVVGWSVARTMSTLGVDRVAFAPGRLAMYAAIGIIAGIVSAALPARRSARLDVLEALRHA
jgi:putative ABC transport system permease protein